MFWVSSVWSLPRRCSSTRARWPTFGSADQAGVVQPLLPGDAAHLGVVHVVVEVRRPLGLGVLRPDAVRAAEVGDARVGGDAGAGEDDDALGLVHPARHLLDGSREVRIGCVIAHGPHQGTAAGRWLTSHIDNA